MKNMLHPGAKWVFRIRGYFIALFLLIFFGSFLIPLITVSLVVAKSSLSSVVAVIVSLSLVFILVFILLVEIYARMAYNRWFYEFTDSNLRMERGVIWKRYSNVPYERVQNVDIHRGILARMLGFSSVMIQTAGYSAAAHTEGYIPAVNIEDAEKIREFLMKKISKRGRSQGL